ncbi:MAG: hypothetical protein ABI821_16895 [Pseudomonadota bacterium]
MKTCLTFLLLISLCVTGSVSAQVAPNDSPAQRTLKEATSSTGSILRRQVAWSTKIPFDKTYEQLTPEEKSYFNEMYESIAPGDEPPYPLEGMRPIVKAIVKGQTQRVASGYLRMAVTVGPDGKGQKVEVYGDVDDPAMLNFAASVLLMTKYKPALCAGKPCTMEFPFNLMLKRRY